MMRRQFLLILSIVILLGTLLIGGSGLAAQDAASPDYSDHPIVGSWIVDSDPEDPENFLEMGTFISDGTMLDSAPDGLTGHGVWEPTGESTAIVNFLLIFDDGSSMTIRATVEVAPDGQSFTSPYTLEFFEPDGTGSGEIGPGTAVGTRMELQEPGTPVASFEEFFGTPAATPDATPAA